MSVTAIILLVILGIILFLLEFLVFPGLTITGIAGIISIGIAIFFAYHDHNVITGNRILIGTLVAILGVFYFVFKSKSLDKISLNQTIEGTVTDTVHENNLTVGQTGKTITRLAPIGKVMINGIVVEGKSTGEFISENTEVEIVKINNNQIVVKTKK